MNNRMVLITGAASGIGKATAIAYDNAGATVFLADKVFPEETAKLCHGEVRSFVCDISDPASVQRLSDSVEFWGIDILVNNAGVAAKPTPFENMTSEEWHRVMSVNLDGTAWMCSIFGKQMIRRGGDASIVNVASMSGLVANRGFYNAHYNASKAAVIQLTRSLASEWANHRIRVNCVCHGPIATPMSEGLAKRDQNLYEEFGCDRTLIGRWGKPEEVAPLILEVSRNTFMTGACVTIDGGYTAW